MNKLKFGTALFSVCAIGIVNICGAQQLVGTAGGDGINGSSLLSWSVGEVAIEGYANGPILTQGVQQPIISIVLALNEVPEAALDLSVYPNPASSHVLLSVATPVPQGLQYTFIDSKGNVIERGNITEGQTVFPIDSFSSGLYMLQLTTADKKLKVFKITKL